MQKDFYNEKYVITDLLFSTNMTKTDIAKDLGITLIELNRRIKSYHLDWVKAKKRKMSRGQSAIVDILNRILPNENIEFEYHVGERLLVDIYIPSYKLGIEYHGRQHYEYSAHFHGSRFEFELSQERDKRKIELCREQGITLAVLRYNDSLNEDSVFLRILDAIKNTPAVNNLPLKEDSEFEKAKAEILDRARKQKKRNQKEWKAKINNDEETKRAKEEFKRRIREDRKQRARDLYFGSGN